MMSGATYEHLSPQKTRILIVDDNPAAVGRLGLTLQAAGYAVSHTVDGLDGLIAVEDDQPAAIVLSWGLPCIDGAIFLHALRIGLRRTSPVIVLLGPDDDVNAAWRAGATEIARKTTAPAEILRLIRDAVAEPAVIPA